MKDSLLVNIKKLWFHIGQARRLQFKFLILLMTIASLAEILSIGAVFPFLRALMDPMLILAERRVAHIRPILAIGDKCVRRSRHHGCAGQDRPAVAGLIRPRSFLQCVGRHPG